MIIVLKRNSTDTDVATVSDMVCSLRYQPRVIRGVEQTVVACIGDELSHQSLEVLRNLPAVESVFPVQKKFKLVSREYHRADSVVEVRGVKIGGGNIEVIAGPCAIESYDQFRAAVQDLVRCGIRIVRAMPFKPRTSPYDFQGLKGDGLDLLFEARKRTGLPIVTEIMNVRDIDLFEDIDVIQVGARNMQNFDLLKELGMTKKPILLKRGLANTLKELLMSAEYVMSGGNENIILCERGIRTYETFTRNTLDLSAVPALHELTHLPVVVDPSHATGLARLVEPMAMAAVAAGADGLMIEVHNDPQHALCDGAQSLTPEQFKALVIKINKIREAITS